MIYSIITFLNSLILLILIIIGILFFFTDVFVEDELPQILRDQTYGQESEMLAKNHANDIWEDILSKLDQESRNGKTVLVYNILNIESDNNYDSIRELSDQVLYHIKEISEREGLQVSDVGNSTLVFQWN